MSEENFDLYGYFKFNKGDKAILNQSIKVRCFIGGFKEIFNTKESSYKYKSLEKGTIVTILQCPDDEAEVFNNQTYIVKTLDNTTIENVPEYLLDVKE